MDTYELQVQVSSDECRYYADRRFTQAPDLSTVTMALSEATHAFQTLYAVKHDYASVALVHLTVTQESTPE